MVENKPGAFGILGDRGNGALASRTATRCIVGNVSTNAITPVLFQKKFSINFEKDVVSVSRLAIYPSFLITTTANFDVKSVPELIAYAKKNPGKVRYTSAGVGSFPHFDMEIFARRAGVDMVHIPNKTGAAGMINDLVVGDAQIAFLNVGELGGDDQGRQAAADRGAGREAPGRLSRRSDPGGGRLSRRRHAALAEHAGAGRHAEGDARDAVQGDRRGLEGARSCRRRFAKQLVSVKPSESLDEAQTWLKGELAHWRKITAEVKIDLAD